MDNHQDCHCAIQSRHMFQNHRRSYSPLAITPLAPGDIKPTANSVAACGTIYNAEVLLSEIGSSPEVPGNCLNHSAARLPRSKNLPTSTLSILPSDRYPTRSNSRAGPWRKSPRSQRTDSSSDRQFSSFPAPQAAQLCLSSHNREM